MRPNVFITARDRGKIFHRWEGHNVWVERGREYLAQMISFSSFSPDTPFILTSRLKHMQFGIGGNQQEVVVIPSNVNTAYPAGFDPQVTSGNEYDHLYPLDPLIATLERPVRISGGSNPYATANPADVWLTSTTPPKFMVTFPTSESVSLRFFISGSGGDIVYAPFTSVPLSEAGLVVSGDANVNAPFNPVVAYVNFTPVLVTSTVEIEFQWIVSF